MILGKQKSKMYFMILFTIYYLANKMRKKLKLCNKQQKTSHFVTARELNQSTIQLWTNNCCKSICIPTNDYKRQTDTKNRKEIDNNKLKAAEISSLSNINIDYQPKKIQNGQKQHNSTFITAHKCIQRGTLLQIKKSKSQKNTCRSQKSVVKSLDGQVNKQMINKNISSSLYQRKNNAIKILLNFPNHKSSILLKKNQQIKDNFVKSFSNAKVQKSLLTKRKYIEYKRYESNTNTINQIKNKLYYLFQCSKQAVSKREEYKNSMNDQSSQLSITNKCFPPQSLVSSDSVTNIYSKEKKKYNRYLAQAKDNQQPQKQKQKQKSKNRPETASICPRNWEFLKVKTMRLLSSKSERGKHKNTKTKNSISYVKKNENNQQQIFSKLSIEPYQSSAIDLYLDKLITEHSMEGQDFVDDGMSSFKKRKISIPIACSSQLKSYHIKSVENWNQMSCTIIEKQLKENADGKSQQQSDKEEDQKNTYLKTINF